MKRFAMGIYEKRNGGEREIASRETEIKCVCEAECMRKREVG